MNFQGHGRLTRIFDGGEESTLLATIGRAHLEGDPIGTGLTLTSLAEGKTKTKVAYDAP